MAKRIGGFRRKTRHKLKKHSKRKGKISLQDYFQEFGVGETVCLKIEPSVHKGMCFPRYSGKRGIIQGKRGRCYEVMIKDGKKEKELIIHPIHLKRLINKTKAIKKVSGEK